MTFAPESPISAETRRRGVQAAQGKAAFDLLLVGGTVVDVATGELRPADVGLVGGLIASVHPPGSRADAAETHDLAGLFLAPGFVDGHVHFESSYMGPADYAAVVVAHGTTTAVWDPHELANVAGLPAVQWAVEASRGLPLRVLVTAPSCVPSAPGLEVGGAVFGPAEMAEHARLARGAWRVRGDGHGRRAVRRRTHGGDRRRRPRVREERQRPCARPCGRRPASLCRRRRHLRSRDHDRR